MNPQTPNPDPTTPPAPQSQDPKLHPMVVLQQREEVVAKIKRHPFGIMVLYISALIGIAVAALLTFIFIPQLAGQFNADNVQSLAVSGLMIIVILMILILGLATAVYWQNEWIITTDSITQISQRGLFTRQVSQLSMDNLEDVTVDQVGIIAKLFNYGTLKVETAGERSKFSFLYCPNPNEYARRILEVHEKFLEDRRNIQNRP
jgi:uncharacterized membrane protein YdbT with pleckstrin-like domain